MLPPGAVVAASLGRFLSSKATTNPLGQCEQPTAGGASSAWQTISLEGRRESVLSDLGCQYVVVSGWDPAGGNRSGSGGGLTPTQ